MQIESFDLEDVDVAAIEAELIRRKGLRAFVERAWHVVEPHVTFVPGWHLDCIADHLEAVSRGEIQRLILAVPPRHMKTTLVSIMWPAWEWIDRPGTSYLIGSYALDLQVEAAVKSRRLIRSDWYQARWGDRFRLTGDQDVKSRFENDHGGARIATSPTGTGTGRGGDRVGADDAHRVGESDGDRRRAVKWWDEEMATRGNSASAASFVIGQRTATDDLIGHLLARGDYHCVSLPAEYEPRGFVLGGLPAHDACDVHADERGAPGAVLWPAQWGTEVLAGRKVTLGSRAYAAQYQQRPSPASGGRFKREWMSKRWTVLPIGGMYLFSWDLAFKATEDSSYVVGQLWYGHGAAAYLVDQVRARMGFTETLQAIRDMRAKHASRWAGSQVATLVEDKANGPAVIATLGREIPGIVPIEVKDSKQARASVTEPLWEAGNVLLPSDAPWVGDFVEELAAFPEGAADDQVDAMSQALTRMLGAKADESHVFEMQSRALASKLRYMRR